MEEVDRTANTGWFSESVSYTSNMTMMTSGECVSLSLSYSGNTTLSSADSIDAQKAAQIVSSTPAAAPPSEMPSTGKCVCVCVCVCVFCLFHAVTS